MATLISFIPKREQTAQQNLENFIVLARYHLPLWSDLAGFTWDSYKWPTTHRSIRFTNHEHRRLHASAVPHEHQLMHPRFMDVAKAILRYVQHHNSTKGIARQLTALRILEKVLLEDMDEPSITKLTQRHFDCAAAIAGESKTPSCIVAELLAILGMLADAFIVTGAARYWSNPYVGTAGDNYINGANAPSDVKAAKVVNQDALLCVAQVFGQGYSKRLEDVDTMVTSLTALLLSAPMRISEPIRFRVDCLSQDFDKDGKVQYFLRYWVPKSREFARKAIPSTMAETTIEAVRRLSEITHEGRLLAKYMETNPLSFYRHKNCPDVPDDQLLKPAEVARALGYTNKKTILPFIHKHTGAYRLTGFTLNTLWQIVLREHKEGNPHFPYQEAKTSSPCLPPKMSETLICARRHQFSLRNETSPVLLAPFNSTFYARRMATTEDIRRKNSMAMCFFKRHGFLSHRLKSHGIRHLLNRLAKRQGVSVEMITLWSNRSSQRQTFTYLNDDPNEFALASSKIFELNIEQTPMPPITNDEADLYGQGPYHRSRYGLCRRSWRVGPCNKFADCLNCSELLICKGDKLANSAILQDHSNLVSTYNAAKGAVLQGERAASRWMKMAAQQIQRLNELLSVLSDDSIPNGSPVELTGANFSHESSIITDANSELKVNLLRREELTINYGADLLKCLDELWRSNSGESNYTSGNE